MEHTSANGATDFAPSSSPLKLVKLRLSLSLVAMAILPLAIAAPLAYSILDGQQNAERLRAERDSTAMAAAIGTRLDRTQQAVVRTAAGPTMAGFLATPQKINMTTARATLLTLGTSTDDGVREVIVQDAAGNVRIWISGGKVASGTPKLPTVDDTLAAALQVEGSNAWSSTVHQDPSGAPTITIAAPVPSVTGDTAVGIVRVEVSLAQVIGSGATGLVGSSVLAQLLDQSGFVITRHAARAPWCRSTEPLRPRRSRAFPIGAAGDELLSEMGRLTMSTVRTADRAFRIGGDEFAVLMPHTDVEGARVVGRRLLASALETRPGSSVPKSFSFSVGISAFPALTSDRRQLYAQSDSALYWAKTHGRTMVQIFEPARHKNLGVNQSGSEVSSSVAELTAKRALRAVYQPIVELRGGRVIGYEALVRPTPESGFSNAGELFAAAEASGRQTELDQTCLEVVIAGAANLAPETILSLNLSPRTLGVRRVQRRRVDPAA